jgi:hypothetical protein
MNRTRHSTFCTKRRRIKFCRDLHPEGLERILFDHIIKHHNAIATEIFEDPIYVHAVKVSPSSSGM